VTLRHVWTKLQALLQLRRRQADLEEEIQFHLEAEAEEHLASGLTAEDARLAARRDFGNVALVRETTREVWVLASLERLVQDVRYGWRMLRSTPLVSLVAVLSLALGIGANTAIFSVLDTLILRRLPVEAADRLTILGDEPGRWAEWTNPIWEQLLNRSNAFDGAFAVSNTRFNLSSRGESELVDGLWASGKMFEILGVHAILGRTFTDEDDRPGGGPDGPVAVISYSFWQRRFGGAADAIGRALTVERVPYTIVGVTPPEFFGVDVGRTFDMAVPVRTATLIQGPRIMEQRSVWWLRIMIRLRPGQTPEAGTALVRGMQQQIRRATLPDDWHPELLDRYLAEPWRLEPAATGDSYIRDSYRRPLTILMVVVGLVLLIACANLTNLSLARASARRHELGVRLALGASRARVARQLLTESLLLSSIGAALGLLLAFWGSRLLVSQLSTTTNRVFLDLTIDWRLLGFTACVAVATSVLFGTAPALRGARFQPTESLNASIRGVIGQGRFGSAQLLVVLQVALSLVLFVSAGLFLRTFTSLANLALGFDSGPILIARIQAPTARIPVSERPELYQRMLDAASRIPGVSGVALSHVTPLGNDYWYNRIELPGRPPMTIRESLAYFNKVSPRWFSTYGTFLLAGRDFTEADGRSSPPVAIVNEAFARRFNAGQSPIGMRVRQPWGITRQVVGYVKDAVYESVRAPVPPTLYISYWEDRSPQASTSLSVRAAAGSASRLARPLVTAITGVHSDLVITLRTLEDQVDAQMVRERVLASLSAFFGALALLLAGLGLYGVTAYSVSRRRSEIGIRIALGAKPGGIVALVWHRAALLVTIGIAVGLGASLWLSQFVESLLFGLRPHDPITLTAAIVVLAAIGGLAAWLPARRASRIDPAVVLREG
jgi:putative ABC transport system permease protein